MVAQANHYDTEGARGDLSSFSDLCSRSRVESDPSRLGGDAPLVTPPGARNVEGCLQLASKTIQGRAIGPEVAN